MKGSSGRQKIIDIAIAHLLLIMLALGRRGQKHNEEQ
jgi:hypothetical protein